MVRDMALIGQRNTLTIVRASVPGLYLDGGAHGDILLPGRYIPAGALPGHKIDVFVYRDCEDRIVATTETPYAEVGQFAFLRAVGSNPRIGVFLDRRFSPAMATCQAVDGRIRSLAERSERASNLLRTRVEVALEAQNQQVLKSMEKRSHQQLRLQETVEGLSVVAISYYLIGILSKIATVLAENKIGIFAVSTYNTDYILVHEDNFEAALDTLKSAGYQIV